MVKLTLLTWSRFQQSLNATASTLALKPKLVQMQLIQQNINIELASIHTGMSGDLKNFTVESAL